jgi:hypothetical protein
MSEVYIEVTGIEWNEGPTYRGPKAFWFIIDEDTYPEVESDPIHKLALFQHIDNELKQSSKYAGVNSDKLQWNVYSKQHLNDAFEPGEYEMIDLTKEKV